MKTRRTTSRRTARAAGADREGTAHRHGRAAEAAARTALRRAGFDVLESNYRIVGAEIDIVACDADGLAFVEVRGRRLGDRDPSSTITSAKLRTVRRGAERWLAHRGRTGADWRIIVVAVDLDARGEILDVRVIDDPFAHLPEFHRS